MKVLKRKNYATCPYVRASWLSLGVQPILLGEQPIRGLILNLDFDKINHNNKDFFFQGGFYVIPLVSF
jgi:hypothetical protein